MDTTPRGRTVSRSLALTTTALLVFGASCTDDRVSVETAPVETAPDTTAPDTEAVAPDSTVLAPVPGGAAVTADEIAGLMWMREEEQLAHDVYVALGDRWGLRIFENISRAETTHIDAVVDLLDRYGLDDPAEGNDAGTFTEPALQDLYDQLVADGSRSLEDALAVGAFVEELDIVDLSARSATTETAEISAVYADLERGSRNHLRAFVSQLDSRGVTYEPTQLDVAAFDAIVSSDTERGSGG
jgi:hypothetical protein